MAAKSIAPLFVDFFLSAEFLTMRKSFDVSNADFLDCQRTLNSIKSANPSTTIGHSCEGKHAPTNNFTSHIATQNYHRNDSLFPHALNFWRVVAWKLVNLFCYQVNFHPWGKLLMKCRLSRLENPELHWIGKPATINRHLQIGSLSHCHTE